MEGYTKIDDDLFISNFCGWSDPCSHSVVFKDKQEDWNGIDITFYILENNLDIDLFPDVQNYIHLYYIKHHRNEEILQLLNDNNKINKREAMQFAVSYNNIEIIKYLEEHHKITFSLIHLRCCMKNDNLELFKYIMKRIDKNHDKENSIFVLAIQNKAEKILDYLMENNYELYNKQCYNSCIFQKELSELPNALEYCINKCKENNIIFYGQDLSHTSKELIDILAKNHLIYNNTFELEIEGLEGKIYDYYKMKLENLIRSNFNRKRNICSITKYPINLSAITIKTSDTIECISLSINKVLFPFTKIDDIYQLKFKCPLHICPKLAEDYSLVFEGSGIKSLFITFDIDVMDCSKDKCNYYEY